MGAAVFSRVVQRGIPGGGMGVRHVLAWKKTIPGREKSKCECPEIGAFME